MDATYINFTLPETGTKAWNKNIKCDERLYTWKLVWSRARSSFLPSRIWAFGVSSHSQSHKLQRLKWHPRWKDHVLHWMDKIIYELQAALMRGKIMLALRPLELDVQPTFCRFFLQMNMKTWLVIDQCLSCILCCQCCQLMLYLWTD